MSDKIKLVIEHLENSLSLCDERIATFTDETDSYDVIVYTTIRSTLAEFKHDVEQIANATFIKHQLN
jgi:hypothetical protein